MTMDPKYISRAVGAYHKGATAAQGGLDMVLDWLRPAIQDDIIPTVQEALPENYSIDGAYSSPVLGHRDPTQGDRFTQSHQELQLPTAIAVELRILYQNEPIGAEVPDDWQAMQRSMRPTLTDIASTYGLAEIVMVGEPIYTS